MIYQTPAVAPTCSTGIAFLHTNQIDSSEIKAANLIFFTEFFVHTTGGGLEPKISIKRQHVGDDPR